MFPEALDDYISEDNPVCFVDAFVEAWISHPVQSETKGSEKPDGLRFVREAQFERFGNGLITCLKVAGLRFELRTFRL